MYSVLGTSATLRSYTCLQVVFTVKLSIPLSHIILYVEGYIITYVIG